MTPVELVLSRCEGVRPVGQSQWEARCKAHEDSRASLSVSQGADGRAVLFCHAGCSAESIVQTMGLQWPDLFADNGEGVHSNGHANGNGKKPQARFWTSDQAIADLEKRLGPRTASWQYRDAKGLEVGAVVRFDLPDGKTIRPVARHVDGCWTVEAMPSPRPLYRLREVLPADVTVWCEGEKCADQWADMGFYATTHAGGSNASGKTDWKPLAGKLVIASPDNDGPGEKCVQTVVGIISRLVPPARIKVLRLPGLEEGGDIVDFVEMRRQDGKDDAAIKAELDALIERAPEWHANEAAADARAAETSGDDSEREAKPPLRPLKFITGTALADLDCRVEYLIPGVLAARQPCVLGGSFKTLKTSVAIDLALSLSKGLRFLGEFPIPRPVRTLLLSGESGDATIKETAERIALSKGVFLRSFDSALFAFELPILGDEDSMGQLLATIEDAACQAEVVIVDPLYLSLPQDIEPGNVFRMGSLFRSVAEVFRKAGATPVIVHHLKRHTGRESNTPAELQDLAWAGCAEFARQWLLLSRREDFNPDDPQHSLWLSVGGSAGHVGLWGLDIDERPSTIESPRSWRVDVLKAGEARSDAIQEEVERRERVKEERDQKQLLADRQKILDVLGRYPDGETKTVLRDASGLKTNRFGIVLAELLTKGIVRPCEIEKTRRKYDGYALSRDQSGPVGETAGTGSRRQPGAVGTGLLPLKGVVPSPDSFRGQSPTCDSFQSVPGHGPDSSVPSPSGGEP